MYKARKVDGGWDVFRIDGPSTPPVLIPHIVRGVISPYPQRQAAYRRCKQLNDADKEIDEMIKRDGAIIL